MPHRLLPACLASLRSARLGAPSRVALLLALCAALTACSATRTGLAIVDGGERPLDAGEDGGGDPRDAGDADAAAVDAGDVDAGSVDAGDVDAGAVDAGRSDAGSIDAGCVAVPEVCNGSDDDCDGAADEDFALASDPANCGVCGLACGADFVCAAAVCVSRNAVVQVAAGSNFTCARLAGGSVYCWGRNGSGQLGRGSTTAATTAAPVMGLDDAIDLDAGELHACAVRAGGRVVCWGEGANGRIGDGAKMSR